MSEKKYDVVSLGSCTMDLLFQVDDIMRMELVDRHNIEKKYVAIENSSKLNVKKVQSYPGGSAANIACDLANIGFQAAYIGGIGDDPSGKMCMENLKEHHVDTTGVKIFPEDSTAHSVILINSKYKDRSILAYKGANDLFSPEHIDKYMLKSTRCFAWTSLTSDKAIQAIQDCINIALEHGAIIAGAPSISILKKRREDAIHLLKQCDVTSMNDEELEEITNKHDVIMGMKQLFEWGLKIVNITLGKEGAMVSDGKILIKTTPPSIHVMDTTGAGDATMSGLIYGILKNLSLYETAQIATSMSAMEIEQEGCRVGLPEKFSALEDFMQSHEFIQETSNFPKFTKE